MPNKMVKAIILSALGILLMILSILTTINYSKWLAIALGLTAFVSLVIYHFTYCVPIIKKHESL